MSRLKSILSRIKSLFRPYTTEKTGQACCKPTTAASTPLHLPYTDATQVKSIHLVTLATMTVDVDLMQIKLKSGSTHEINDTDASYESLADDLSNKLKINPPILHRFPIPDGESLKVYPSPHASSFPPRPQLIPAPLTTEHVFMLHLLDRKGTGKAMIEWAVQRMQDGCEAEYTTLLAGADHEQERTIHELFLDATQENNFTIPTEEEEPKWLENYLCRAMLAGHIAPQKALTWLNLMSCISGYAPRFQRWEDLSDAICYWPSEEDRPEQYKDLIPDTIDDHILHEARKVLAESD